LTIYILVRKAYEPNFVGAWEKSKIFSLDLASLCVSYSRRRRNGKYGKAKPN
jgi:hypothetical protein